MKFDDFPAKTLMEITTRPPLVFVRGEGSWLWDHEGKRYLDFVQGWAVNCLGHCPEVITKALAEQSRKLITPSPAFYNEPSMQLCPAHRRAQLLSASVLHQQRGGGQ
jgi:acetylornithine/N-succinyldiaminopimelate aminotransferase